MSFLLKRIGCDTYVEVFECNCCVSDNASLYNACYFDSFEDIKAFVDEHELSNAILKEWEVIEIVTKRDEELTSKLHELEYEQL